MTTALDPSASFLPSLSIPPELRRLFLPGVTSACNLVTRIVEFSHEDWIDGGGASVLNATRNVREIVIDPIAPTELVEAI